MRTLPLLTVLFIPIMIAVWQGRMYPWAMPLEKIAEPHIREHLEKHKFILAGYLNLNGFLVRAALYFLIWNVLSFLLSTWSREGDSAGARDNTDRFKAVSGPGLILLGGTLSFAAIDWVMSLDPSWISTIFGLVILIGGVLAAMCFAVVVERILYDYKPMSEMLKPDFVHDHGKWMLAFTMVWAYFNFSQWLIIWAGNLPAGNHLLHPAHQRRMGIHRPDRRNRPLHDSVRHPLIAVVQARHSQAGMAGGVAAVYAMARSVVDHRAEFLEHLAHHCGRYRGFDRDGVFVDGVFLPQPEFAAAAAGLRSVGGGSAGAGASSWGRLSK